MARDSGEDRLQLSGLQHFLFCRRQWALIHIENIWCDNVRTVEGNIMHARTYNETLTEKRGDLIITRGMGVFSNNLGVSGKCDVVEFHKSEQGVRIHGWDGLWEPYPVEYKRGEPKTGNCDCAQLCAQAMCLEEMLCCAIAEGALFYGETKRRQKVLFTDELRSGVQNAFSEMHALYGRGHTPRVKPQKACRACSLVEQCMPGALRAKPVKAYIEESLCEKC